MFKNYLKVAWRYLLNNKTHSLINIAGLSVGMAVTILIGLWIWDELSFDKYHTNHDRIAQVWQKQTFNSKIATGKAVPMPLGEELRRSFKGDFRYVVMSSLSSKHVLNVDDKSVARKGCFMEEAGPELFTLNMLKGTRAGLKDPGSVLVSRATAIALFGDADPVNKVVKLDNKENSFKVTGVYEDLPENTTLNSVSFIASWYDFTKMSDEKRLTDWNNNSVQTFVQVADQADMATISEKIRQVKSNMVTGTTEAKSKPMLFLHPMNKWHLYGEFTNGVNTGGNIEYVWLFAIIGFFILLLACINFMNLSTARSEKRAREVGIRKAIGSVRTQLVIQFFCESTLVALLAFALSILLVLLILPFFNGIANKEMTILWGNPGFWLLGIGFSLFTGLLAGSYPALYLSSFRPIKVLKGVFKTGHNAAIPRRVLVVLQFAVSVMLIICTIVVFNQIQFGMKRPVGYNRDGLISIEMVQDDLYKHFESVRNDLLRSGKVAEVALSTSATTRVNNFNNSIDWNGKDPAMTVRFATVGVTGGYGKTVGWQFIDGRDFSPSFPTDSSGVVLNEASVQYMGLKDPVGQLIKWGDEPLHVIGVIRNMIMESPYDPVTPTIFNLRGKYFDGDYINIRINPDVNATSALETIASVSKTYAPSMPFEYKFADEEYARKFRDEERTGKLASFFAILAIFISCLGLFGMSAFIAEQRIREIGIRKVLGASVLNLWSLLSKEFLVLVTISLLIAVPLSYYFMHNWLQNYQYRSGLPWWIFVTTAAASLLITLLTVSFQSIKAAITNPVKSLRAE
jgi:putative ABC transport system permease protein